MKRFISIILLLVSLAPLGVIAQTTAIPTPPPIRCPIQPKIQKGTNYVFFSFSTKTATVKSYIPANLVLIDPQYLKSGPRCVTAQTYTAFLSMSAALKAETGQTIVVSSAWRSTQTQSYFAKARSDFAALP